MREREVKRGSDTNEVASFKFHYLEFIIKEISRLQKKQQEQLQRLQEVTTFSFSNKSIVLFLKIEFQMPRDSVSPARV